MPRVEKHDSADIIVVGSELVSGDVKERNGQFLAERLLSVGIKTRSIILVGDEEASIGDALGNSIARKDIRFIVVTGGLGPTADDITSRVVSKTTGRRLVISDEALQHIRSTLDTAGKKMLPSHERQALIPQRAKILRNPIGTACGYTMRHEGKLLVFLPGEPKEAARMTDAALLPILRNEVREARPAARRTFRTFGLAETEIEERITPLIGGTRELRLSCLPSITEVTLRISAEGGDGKRIVEEASEKIREALGDYIFAEDEMTMEEAVGNLLRLRGRNLAVAESCTGGLISHRITNVPGSSDYFMVGFLTYSNEAKTKLLGVRPELIAEHGAVSREVASAMSAGAYRMGRTSYGLAVTGIAGPSGGSPEKPVGTVFISLTSDRGTDCRAFRFSGDREDVKNLSAQTALEILRRDLLAT